MVWELRGAAFPPCVSELSLVDRRLNASHAALGFASRHVLAPLADRRSGPALSPGWCGAAHLAGLPKKVGVMVTNRDGLRTPEYWRRRAEEARKRAAEMHDEEAKLTMENIAVMYEALGGRSARRMRKAGPQVN